MSNDPNLEQRRQGDGKFGPGRNPTDDSTAASRADTLDDGGYDYEQFAARLVGEPVVDRKPVLDTIQIDLTKIRAAVPYEQTDADREWWEPHVEEAEQLVADLEYVHPRLNPRPTPDQFPGTVDPMVVYGLRNAETHLEGQVWAAKRAKLAELLDETKFDPPLNEYARQTVVASLRQHRAGQWMGGIGGGPALQVPSRKLRRQEQEDMKAQAAQLDRMWNTTGRDSVTEAVADKVETHRAAKEAHAAAAAANADYDTAVDAWNRLSFPPKDAAERHRTARTIVDLGRSAPGGGQFHAYPEQAGLQRRSDGGWNAWLRNGERVVDAAPAGRNRGQGAGVGLIGERGGENVGLTHYANRSSTKGTGEPIYVPPCDTDGPHFKMPLRNSVLDSGD